MISQCILSTQRPNPNGNLANGTASSLEKRQREERMDEDQRQAKRERTDRDEDEGEEMEIEDDEETVKQAGGAIPAAVQQQSSRLMCLNLPQEVTEDVLSVLFQQYQGFLSTQVVQSPTPNAAGQKVKMAYVLFDSPDLAAVAKEALDGFALKKGWVIYSDVLDITESVDPTPQKEDNIC
ncbi:hypothetical protein A0H81_03709 [Grifola frondosa]|uniref:RRM domain-containing protein n=1 Tax=Grifola frondosa TaxID=5627 RepID=A0A1C7MI94_GRIFR|nr:hypothetical protein A0H81_03709 [Grifola frondosa]